ncbi:MAG: hypothetical protein WCH34_08145 [Bacteroidota bacterium]
MYETQKIMYETEKLKYEAQKFMYETEKNEQEAIFNTLFYPEKSTPQNL